MARLKNATRFTTNDIQELRKRFYRMSNGNQFMTKAQFRENMGLLGLDTVYFLSDRIFSILDDDKDEKVRFEEFVFYFDKITNGDQMEKGEISYKLIDQDKIGFFTLQDFQTTMNGLIQSWVIMTGQPLATDMQQRLEFRIIEIFNKMDANKDQKVSLSEYQDAIIKDPTLLDIFDFLKKGINTSIQEAQFKREQMIIEEFSNIQEQALSIYHFMLGYEPLSCGINVPRATMRNRQSLQSKYTPNLKHKQNDKQSGVSGVPYLLGEDEEQVNQRLPWVPIRQTQVMKNPIINSGCQIRNPQQDNMVQSAKRTNSDQIDQLNQRSFTSDPKPDQEVLHPGEISLRMGYHHELHRFEIRAFQERETDNKDVASDKENSKFDVFSPKDVYVHPSMANSLPVVNGFMFQQGKSIINDFSPNLNEKEIREIEERISKLSDLEIRQQYKEAVIKIKLVSDTMFNAIEKLQNNQFQKERDFLEKQHKERQLVHLRIKTAANVHKSTILKQIKSKSVGKLSKEKKQLSVQFGHENWNLVLNMMIGIQMAVKSVNVAEDLVINPRDFQIKYYFELLPRRIGQDKETFKICKFYDYAPQVFNSLRRIYGIDNEDYLASIGPETLLSSLLKGDLNSLRELTSTGKSGSFFYYSADAKFTLKTISRDEFTFLKSLIKNYYEHLKKYNQTLLIKFFGMHKIYMKQAQSKKEMKIYFIIMSNVFHTQYEIHQRFDLKGSLYKRFTAADADPSVARKDLDFIKSGIKLQVDPIKRKYFLDQVNHDCNFFWENNIIDYSMLLGIHNIKQNSDLNQQPYQEKSEYSIMSEDLQEYLLPENISVMRSLDESKLYFFGIIDILTNFNTKKKIEYIAKRVAYGPTISAVPPSDYAMRFRDFMIKIFDDTPVKPQPPQQQLNA